MIDKNSDRIARNSKKYASNFYLRAIETLQKVNKENSTLTESHENKIKSNSYLNKITKANISHPSTRSHLNQLDQNSNLITKSSSNATKTKTYIQDTA
jgi:hypothetical protein